jgi:hypothetical protein
MPSIRTAQHSHARLALILVGVALTGLLAPAARADIVRTFDFSPRDARVVPSPDGAVVSLVGGVPDGKPGEPELPAVPVCVDVAAGTHVRSVSFEGLGWVSLGTPAGKLRTAASASPGFPRVGSDADAALYASADWFPAVQGAQGPTGSMRGRMLTSFSLRPLRVRPATGELEIATRIVVRIVTDVAPDPDAIVRRRVVPEWESAFAGMSRRYGRGLDDATAPADYGSARVQHAGAVGTLSTGGGFTPSSVPSVEGSPVQFLIITNNAMSSQLQRLADWHTRAGMPTVVRTTEFISANYPYGVDMQDRIRRFIRDAYAQWGITHVLLAGDTDIIPPRYAFTTFFGGNYIPADLYYSDLDRNWNADGDSLYGEGFQDSVFSPGDNVDLFPDVYVGRAPIINATQAQTFVDKTLMYEETPVGDYEDRAIYAAEVLFPQDWNPSLGISVDGASDAESAIHKLTPEMKPRRMYENYVPYDTVGAVQLTRAALLDSLTRGWGVMHHVGHGYRNSMSVGDAAITNPDADALQNGNRTWVLYSIDCTSNAIDFACLGEAFVNNPHGGAVANVGSTREDFPITGRSYQDEWYDLVFQDTVPTIGQAFAQQKVPFVPLAYFDNTHRWTQYTLCLLGDPALPVWWRKPQPLTVTFPATVPLSDTTFAVHVTDGSNPVVNALVCFDKSGEEYQVASTNGTGDVIMRVRPETTGPASLTVSKTGFHPFEGTVTIGAPTAAVLVSRAADRVLVDNGTGGSTGNGDGGADAGETIAWTLPVSNTGSLSAPIVVSSLSTTDPRVNILVSGVSYDNIPAGGKVSGNPYILKLDPSIPDGTEVLFQLDLFSGLRHFVDSFRLPVHAPNLLMLGNTIVDNGTNGTSGNGNGHFDVGENVLLTFNLRNSTSGSAHGLTATLSTTTPGITIPTPTATLPDMPPGTNATTSAFRVVSSTGVNPSLTLTINDAYGVRFTRQVDLVQPGGVSGLVGTGAASTITLVWAKSPDADLVGYNVYRSTNAGGPFVKVNVAPTDRSAYFVDENLPPLSRFYYAITSVDSSGNESALSTAASMSTNPPIHAGWPQPMGRTTPSSPLIGNIDHSSDSSYEIMAGSDVLWCWHADGSALRDADGTALTAGDFTTEGSYYAAGATLADLNNDGTWEIIAPSWDTKQLFVFEPNATHYGTFPKQLYDNIWSSPAVGVVDASGQQSIVFGSNGVNFYAFHADGTELRDGDNNASTTGVFKVLGGAFNYGSPALADLDGDGKLDIIYGSTDGFLYAWKGDGTNLPGFPVNLFAGTTCSPAVGDIDNDGQLEIVITATNNKLYVVKANGTMQPGFPVTNVVCTGASRCPSPALADMEGTGQKDIVINTTDGYVKVFRPNGSQLSQWTNVRYSYPSQASESSPVVADIDGDGQNEVIVGGEDANLYAFDNDGTLMAGFPIKTGGEVRGTPTVWDIDKDGQTEIILSDWDKNLYVWDYPGTFNPNGAPAWAMWRHDQYRQGRLGAPIVVAAGSVAFSAALAPEAGLDLTFAMPASAEAAGSYDIYRAEGPGETGQYAYNLPSGFARINEAPIAVSSGSLIRWLDASALPGRAYRYLFLRRQDRPGDTFLAYGPFAATASAEAPSVAFVTQNFPNPAHGGRTTIAYGVPQSVGARVHTTLRFYDVRGRLVRSLVDGLVPPGRYQVSWDGKDDHGAGVAPGVYFYEYSAGPTRLTKKALFLGP